MPPDSGIAPDADAGAAIGAAVATHCPYCALQCGMNLVRQEGRLAVTARDFPTNRGGLCRKGWTAAELLDHPERLTTPLMRATKGAELRPATWEAALDRIVAELRRIQAAHGPDSAAVFGGGGLTNEKAYLLGKFARVGLGTKNIDYNGRFCMASAAAAGQAAFGIDRGMPFPMADIPGAEVILLVGGNPAETMPPIMQWFDAQRAAGGQLIVVDPRFSATAQLATLHLPITPGTDAALANGLLHICLRDRLIDERFIAERTTGFEPVRRIAAGYWPDRVERITGIPAERIEHAAALLGRARTVMVLSGRGPEQQSHGVDNVLAFINLALALGQAGKPFSGYGCMTGQGNGQGGREHGQKSDQLPGYRKIADPAHRAEIAAIWDVPVDTIPGPGLSIVEQLDVMGTDIRALLVFASNLVVSAPRSTEVKRRLDALDLLVVADPFLSDTAERADIVLPCTQWAEEDGTMTNLEGRIIRRRAATAPPPGVWTDTAIIAALAERLGRGRFFAADPAIVAAELRRASAGGIADYAGATWERVEAEQGVFWPCPSADHPGTPRLFLDRFGHPDGRARFVPVEFHGPAETPDCDYPFHLTTGRVLVQYQTGTQTRRVQALHDAAPEPFVEINPQMARGLGIADGDMVRLTTRRGHAILRARFTRSLRMDTVFVPFHWAGRGSANLLTNPVLDATSRMPEFKVCAVKIEKEGEGLSPSTPLKAQPLKSFT